VMYRNEGGTNDEKEGSSIDAPKREKEEES
jgi:hypothetical protein